MVEGLASRSERVWLSVLVLASALAGCATTPGGGDGFPDEEPDVASIPDAVPKAEPRSRYGNPKSYVVFGQRYYVMGEATGYVERGIASWYGKKFHGKRTSSGEIYNMYSMTAAHKSLPLPTYVAVTNLANHRRVILKVNDRGPFHDNRLIDLSYTAARKLGIIQNGTGLVEIRAIETVQAADSMAATKLTEAVRLFLQVGAYEVRENARRVMARLESLGDSLRISEVLNNGRRIYRVRFGPLSDVGEADRLGRAVVGLGLDVPRIVLE